jgi:hypothetical protein
MDTPQMPPAGRLWRNGKRLTLLQIGEGRLVITEHFIRVDGKLVPGAITARLERPRVAEEGE